MLDIRGRVQSGYHVLREAAEIAGYSSGYIGWLIRKGKIKGRKIYTGGSWQTTAQAIINYKNKRRKKEFFRVPLSNPKQFISLKAATEISGYASDYIGWLIRTGRIEGRKICSGFVWQTTEAEIKKYQLRKRKKIRRLIPKGKFSFRNLENFGRKKWNKVFYFASRFALAGLAVFILQGSLISAINAINGEESKFINFYSSSSAGEWQNIENVQGQPNVLPTGDINSFSETNSAIYKTGPLNLTLEKFETDKNLTNDDFQAAKIKFSFAIGEKKPDFELLPISTTTGEAIAIAIATSTESDAASTETEVILPEPATEITSTTETTTTAETTTTIEIFPTEDTELIEFSATATESTTTIESPDSEVSIISKSKNFVINLSNRIKTRLFSFVFKLKELGFKVVNAQDASTTATSSELFSELDTKIIIWYSLNNLDWQKLTTISNSSMSNALNGGYFKEEAPFIKSFEDIKNLKIKFEGVVGGETKAIAYLDSVWIEASYRENENDEFQLKALKKDWRADEEPEFEVVPIREKKENIFEKLTAGISSVFEEEPKVEADLITPKNDKLQLLEGTDFSTKTHSPTKIKIFRTKDFRPGLHKLKVDFEKDGKVYKLEQDFTWGVLAINVNKSIYLPNEQSYLQMAVLDEKGHTICDAELNLEITSPDGITELFITPAVISEPEPVNENEDIDEQEQGILEEEILEKIQQEENPEETVEATTTEATTTDIIDTALSTPATSSEETSLTEEATTTETIFEATTTDTENSSLQFETSTSEIQEIESNPETTASITSFWNPIRNFISNGANKIKNPFAILDIRAADEELTENGSPLYTAGVIERSTECGPNNVTYTPDYWTYYKVKGPGNYQIKLTAKTKNGVYSINDSFEVRKSVPFEVERIGPTRIYPPASYEMKMIIKVNQDFSGEVIETVPISFEILNQELRIRNQESGEFTIHNSSFVIREAGNNAKELIWQNIVLKSGDEIEIKYTFDAPDISPYLYLLGPLEFTEN